MTAEVKNNNKKKSLYVGLVVILLIFILPNAIRYFIYGKSEGTVIQIGKGYFHSLGGDSTAFELPIIGYKVDSASYTYAKGNEVLYSVPKVGDKITVIYNPKDPEAAYLNKFGSFWFSIPQAMICVLLCIVWIGVVNIIFVKPRKKKSKIQDEGVK